MANSKKECKEQAMISTNICPIWAIPGDKVAGHSEGRDMQHRWYRNMRTPGRAQDLFGKAELKWEKLSLLLAVQVKFSQKAGSTLTTTLVIADWDNNIHYSGKHQRKTKEYKVLFAVRHRGKTRPNVNCFWSFIM